MLVTLNDSKVVESVQPIVNNILVAAGTTYSLPGVSIADIVELRGAIRLVANAKFKVQVRYDTASVPTVQLSKAPTTVIDNSTTANISDRFTGEPIAAGGYYIVQIVNADTVDLTVSGYYERRLKKFA